MQTDQNNNNGQRNQEDQFDDTLDQQSDSSQNTESQSDGQTLSGSQNRDAGQEWGNDENKPGSQRLQGGNSEQRTDTESQDDAPDSGPNRGAGDYGEATGEDFEQSQQGENGTLNGTTNTNGGSQDNRSEHNVDSSRNADDGGEPEDESSRSK